jgi:hypothetical protein
MGEAGSVSAEVAPSACYVCLGRSPEKRDFWSSPRDLSAVVLLVLPLLILLSTWIDGTISIDGGKGFSQHHGFWVIFVTTPGLILLSGTLLDRFVKILSNPGEYLSDRATAAQRSAFDAIVEEELQSLRLQSPLRYALYFGVLVGLCYFIINVIKTWRPQGTYGHDVFDAWQHLAGYLTTKCYLLPVFLLVYPVAIFVAFHVTWSMVRVLRYLCNNDVLEISYFHEDDCGGTSCFGEINLFVMAIYTLLFAVLLGMLETHDRTYFVTRSGAIFCSVAITVQSVAAVWAIHAFVRKKKQARLREITKRLDEDLESSLKHYDSFRNDLLAARNHVHGIHTFPYAAKVALAVNGLRFAPAAIAIISFVTR